MVKYIVFKFVFLKKLSSLFAHFYLYLCRVTRIPDVMSDTKTKIFECYSPGTVPISSRPLQKE